MLFDIGSGMCGLRHSKSLQQAKFKFAARTSNKLPRRKQRGIENLTTIYYAASGGEFNPECRLKLVGEIF